MVAPIVFFIQIQGCILRMTSCECNERAAKPKLLKVEPLSNVGNNKLIVQGEELGTSANLRVFVLNNYIFTAFKAPIYKICVLYLVFRRL